MIEEQRIGGNIRQARTRPAFYSTVVALTLSMVFASAVAWVLGEVLRLNFPVWAALAAPVVGLTILLIGLFKYDWLVLLTFSLIGIVEFEPAPFDLLLVVLLAIGMLTGRLRWPSARTGALVHLGIWGLAVMNLLSTFSVISGTYNLRFLGITLYMLSLFVFIRMYTVQPNAMRLVLIGYTVSAVVNALPVVLSFLGVSLPFSVLVWSNRGIGFFKDSNVYGPFLIVAALWLMDRAMQPPLRPARTGLLLLFATLFGVGAIFSLSRAAWINLALGICIYIGFLFRLAPRKSIAFTTFTLFFVVTTLLIFQYLGMGEFTVERWKLQDYDEVRFSIQKAGLEAGLTHTIGVGPGGWPNTHSLYVRTLAEQGILGLASLGLIIGGVVFPLVRRASMEGEKIEVITARVLLAIMAGQLVNSLVIDTIHWRHLWVVLGLAWALQGMHKKDSR